MTTKTRVPTGIENQPVNTVTWVDRNELKANDYNPNHVPPTELRLLKLSILEDGWTQPIVARRDGEIVDGFHRWTVGGDKEVMALTGGLVPVAYLRDDVSLDHQMASTIRHNRARGHHAVLKMADIVAALVNDHSVDPDRVAEVLGMEDEEVDRLLDRGNMLKRGAGAEFNKGWEPTDREPVSPE